jgi:hypothetical protein
MKENNITGVNSGVHANTGMNFQKHCTIYLLLDKYHDIKDTRYFIILEHHDDIVFGYLNELEELVNVETYQAKKSTNKWTTGKLLPIIKKIVETGEEILNDKHMKEIYFSQKNYFVSNNTIDINCKKNGEKYFKVINEENDCVCYSELHNLIQDKIKAGNQKIFFSEHNIAYLNNLYFRYIDLSQKSNSQFEQLIGKFDTVFGQKIADHKAALKTLLFRFNQIESILNKGNIAELRDKSKRLESEEIENIFQILTTKSLALDFWREKSDDLCKLLKISMADRITFEQHYLNSIEKFKDLKEVEHRKIYSFVATNGYILEKCFSDVICIESFFKEFLKAKSTTLKDLQLKATISAAYIKSRNNYEG